MALKDSHQRVAFSPGEFAALFGKSQTWGYRQIYAGKVKAVTEYGRMMIPADEVEAVLAKAGVYSGLKKSVKKQAADPWLQFIAARRKKQEALLVSEKKLPFTGGSGARADALNRLLKKPRK